VDMFRFTPNPSSPTTLVGGEYINGYLSAMWVERYQDCGEFQIKAKLSSGLREFLPLDTFISRPCTFEVMVVENHEITDNDDIDPILTISGRSMFSILDRRVVGVFQMRQSMSPAQYQLSSNLTSYQTVNMINEHIYSASDGGDRFDNISASSSISSEPNSPTRSIKFGDMLEAVKSLCAIDDQGFRTLRRSPFFIYNGTASSTVLTIYKGVNKTASVIFSYQRGDIDQATYLWTNKNYKTHAYIFGQQFYAFAENPAITKLDRRMMTMDAGDIESHYPNPPSVQDQSWINGDMKNRGFQQLASQRKVTMAQVDISPFTSYLYRRDYGMGDLVMVDGNFGVTQAMRVIEHVEIQDENGTSAHPTLVLPPS
jgi:Siphovirus ReqiPepy6 Gp37-like protein